MKVYLDDEKTHVDPCPHNGHSVGWTVMTETIVLRAYCINIYCAATSNVYCAAAFLKRMERKKPRRF